MGLTTNPLFSQKTLQSSRKYPKDKVFVLHHPPTPVLLLVIPLHPCSALAVTVDKLWAPLSGLWELGKGVLLNQSSHLTQNEGAGARQCQRWCEEGPPSQTELDAFGMFCLQIFPYSCFPYRQ